MISMVFFLVVGVALLGVFLLLGPKRNAGISRDVSAVTAVAQMIRLGCLSFTNSKRLLDDSEYRVLLAEPRLHKVARKLRSDRRDLVLQWASVLQSDMNSLWRFRRLLVRHGATVKANEELQVLQTFLCCWGLLVSVKVAVRLAGPFAAPRLVRQANHFVGGISDVVAGTLSRVPAAVWPEIERNWAAQAAAA